MNKDDNLNSENMLEKCCFCVGGGYTRIPKTDEQGPH